jgi:hypothetical protein
MAITTATARSIVDLALQSGSPQGGIPGLVAGYIPFGGGTLSGAPVGNYTAFPGGSPSMLGSPPTVAAVAASASALLANFAATNGLNTLQIAAVLAALAASQGWSSATPAATQLQQIGSLCGKSLSAANSDPVGSGGNLVAFLAANA